MRASNSNALRCISVALISNSFSRNATNGSTSPSGGGANNCSISAVYCEIRTATLDSPSKAGAGNPCASA